MKYQESETMELKASTAQIGRAMETICALANTKLGAVYFGIEDDGTVTGLDVSDRKIRKITTDILSQIEPRLFPNIWVEEIEGKTVIKVEIKNAPDKPYFYKGKAYKRVGTSNVFLSRYEIEKFLYERSNPAYHYDKTVAVGYKRGINQKGLSWFLNKARKERNLPVDDSADENIILEKLDLLTENQLNFAGLLAFGTDITLILPNAYIKCAVFEGVDKTGKILDHTDIKEDVFRQIDLAESFVLRNIRKSAEINSISMRRESRYEIPYRAIREAVANAVAHRDYRTSSTIDVALFDDRIEIWSPGTLPRGMTLEILQQNHSSVLRNPALAELLYMAGYIEHWGTGIKNMKKWMLDYDLPEPEYREDGVCFIVTFKRKIEKKHPASTPQVLPKYPPSTPQVLELCMVPRRRDEIQNLLKLKDRKYLRKAVLAPLLKDSLLTMTIPDKPRSSKQQYVTTEKGRELLKGT